MLNEVIDNILKSYLFWMLISLFLLFIFAIVREERDNLKKEKLELENENKKLEYFVIEYLLLKMKNVESMQSFFLSMVCDYENGKELPNNFSYLICAYPECYEEMKVVIQKEIVRLTSYVTLDELQRKTFEQIEVVFSKQQKLNALLDGLEKINKDRYGHISFFNAPDTFDEQAHTGHQQNKDRPPGAIAEM